MSQVRILFWCVVAALLGVEPLLGANNGFRVGNCGPAVASYSTISAAVSSVPAGSVVHVCPGTCPEQVTIAQPPTLSRIPVADDAQAMIARTPGGLTQTAPTDDSNSVDPTIEYQVWVNNTSGTVNRQIQAAPVRSYLAHDPNRAASSAQLAIENPEHLQVPEQKADLLLSTACRVVAEKFRISNPTDHLFSLKLVLGSKDEHYTADADNDAYTLFLEHWDENKFTVAVTTLAIQRLVIHDRLPSIVTEVLQRSAQVAPVPVTQLRESKKTGQPLRGSKGLGEPLPSETPGCLSSITEAAVRKIPCGPMSNPAPPSTRW